jgi:site-specific recombinase XerD
VIAEEARIVDKRTDEWLAWLAFKGLLPNTLRLYSRTMERLEEELGAPDDLTRNELEDWLQGCGGSPSTVGNRISALRSFYRWQVLKEYRDSDPTLTLIAPKRRKRLPKPVKNLEAALLILDDYDRRRGEGRWYVGQTRDMATFLLETGLRMHEAVGLVLATPCPEEAEILGKGAKLARISMTEEARQAWDRLGGRWPIGARATQRRFERAGFHPHQLRHTLGCQLAESGADLGEIQDILRHESPDTTRGYVEYNLTRLKAAQARRKTLT